MVSSIPQYSSLRVLATILRVGGIAVVVVAGVLFLVALSGITVVESIIITPAFLIYGVAIFAVASFLDAIRDIAINSWHTRQMLERGPLPSEGEG